MARKGIFFIVLMSLILASCGGGGGGSNEPDKLVYSGKTTAADLTVDNAGVVVNNLNDFLDRMPSAFVDLNYDAYYLILTETITNQAQSTSCTTSGSALFSGTINPDGSGNISISFNNCTEDRDVLDGQIQFSITMSGSSIAIMMSFDNLSYKGQDFNYTSSGSVNVEEDFFSGELSTTFNTLLRDNNTGVVTKQENLLLTSSYYNVKTVTGRIYNSSHGFVDLSMTSELRYSDINNVFPEPGGQILLTGLASSKASMIYASTEKVRIEIDADGDDSFEDFRVYYWTDLGGQVAPNEAPIISNISFTATEYFTVNSISIDTSMATDPDADPLSFNFAWYKNGQLVPEQVTSTFPSNLHAKGDVINAEVTVFDGVVSVSKSVSVTILNSPPVVNAGIDRVVTFGDVVNLSGSAVDDDNDLLTYTWSVKTQPFDGNAQLSDPSLENPELSYSGQDGYVLELMVSDGDVSSNESIEVTVEPMPIFMPYSLISNLTGIEAVAIGDVNNDGLKDVVVTTAYSNEVNQASRVHVFLQDLSGNLSEPVNYDVGLPRSFYFINSVAIADANNDGLSDVIISYPQGVGVMLQNLLGTLDPVVVHASNHSSFSNSRLVVAADFNNDNLSDIASIDWGTQSVDVDVYLQNISTGFDLPSSYPSFHGGYDDLSYGDVNGDGLNDIIVVSGQVLYSQSLTILYQQSDATFGPAVTYDLNIDSSVNAVGVGDVNGDSRDDIIIAYGGNKPSSKVAVLYQTITGELEAPVKLLSYDIPSAVEIADINGDGMKDIITSHSGWFALSVYLQKPDGTLMGQQRYPSLYSTRNPHRMAVGDINGDGSNDVVESNGTGIVIHYHQ